MKYLYYWVLLGCFSLTTAYSQCLVSYLPLNTGFNPTQYTPLSAGTTSAPIHDHYWGTDSATSSISGSLVGSGAYVIQRYSAWAMAPGTQPSNWLSCVNSNGYTINGNGSTAYNMVLGRSFRLCSADSVRVSLRIANDNYISRIDIDGTTVLSFAQSAGRTAGNYDSFTAFTQVIYLPAGTHRLHIKCHNFNDSAGFNYAGLCIYGSVSSATGKPTLIYESDTTCNSYACNTLPAPLQIRLPDTLLLCTDSSIRLPATLSGVDSVLSIRWSPGGALSDSTVLAPIATTTTSTLYRLTTRSLSPTNLLANGSFNYGYTAFTSVYSYTNTTTSPEKFGIGTNPNTYDGSWATMGDHTTGTGNMMIIDGSTTTGISPYCITIKVEPYTDYKLSAWIALLHATSPPILSAVINGSTVFSYTPSGVGTWVQQSGIWNSGTDTIANFCFYNARTVGYGNDFALDDLSFQKINESIDSVWVRVIPHPTVNLGSDTVICAGSILRLQSSVVYTAPVTYRWSRGDSTAYINTTLAGRYSLTVAEYGCPGTDTITVSLKPNPIVNLGNDTGFCAGTVVRANILPTTGVAYHWSTGDTTNTLRVDTTATYWVRIDSNGCSSTDTIRYTTSPLFNVRLGNDTTYCLQSNATLRATLSFTSSPRYLWSTGDSTDTLNTATAGVYWLKVTQGVCTRSDTVVIDLVPYFAVNIGNDTLICTNTPYTLRSLSTLPSTASLLWSNGSTATSITGSVTSTYWLRVTVRACSVTDSIKLHLIPIPISRLGNDTSICSNVPLNVSVTAGPGTNFVWSNGANINNITIVAAGKYWFYANDSGCTASDTLKVTVRQAPAVHLGSDIDVCADVAVVLQSTDGYTSPSYLWNTGATTSYIIPTTSGRYWLEVSQNNCTARDTINVNLKPVPNVNLGNDTAICKGGSMRLSSSQPGGAVYLWNTGSTGSSITADTPGLYSLTVTLNGCSSTDTLSIREIEPPVFNFGLRDTTLCAGFEMPLIVISDFATYLWQDGSTANHYTVTQPGTYSLQVTNFCGTAADTITVQYKDCDLWIPNAFTPDGDTRNDIFRIKGNVAAYTEFKMSIYNRWGQLVFYSEDAHKGWDGTFNNTPQEVGTYFYYISYKLLSVKGTMKGYVVLIR